MKISCMRGGQEEELGDTMYTHVSKCKNDKRKMIYH
jgi:hypothetical protein